MRERKVAADAIRERLAEARAGRGGAVFVHGDAGMGKTWLLGEVAGAGLHVGRAYGSPIGSGVPFDVMTQALSGLGVDDLSADTMAGRCYRVWQALRSWSGAPAVLVIDDLHWADADSLTILAFLCRRLGTSRVAVVAALRAWPPAALDLARDLEESGCGRTVELEPLGERSSAALLARRAGHEFPAETVRTLQTMCAGNPLLLDHAAGLLTAGADLGRLGTRPPDLARRELLVRRFLGATPEAMRCARAGSVLGLSFEPGIAMELADLDLVEADEAVAGLQRGRLIRETPGGRVEFVHPLFHQILYDEMPTSTRLLLHTRAFGLLVRQGSRAEAAEHALRGNMAGDRRAVEVLERVGRDALAVGATETAARYLAGAHRLAGDHAEPGLGLVAGRALMAVGRASEAVAMLGAVSRHEAADVATAAQAAWMAGRAAYQAGDHRQGEGDLVRAAGLAAEQVPAIAVEALLDHANFRHLTEGSRALPLAARALEHAVGVDPALRRRVTSMHGYIAFLGADLAGLEEVTRAAREIEDDPAAQAADVQGTWGALSNHAFAAKWAERFAACEKAFALVIATAERAGAIGTLSMLYASHAEFLARVGRLSEGFASVAQARAVKVLAPMSERYVAAGEAWLLLLSGDLEECERRCAQVEHSASRLSDVGTLIAIWYVRGRRALFENDLATACALFDLLDETTERAGIREPCLVPFGRDAIVAYTRIGRREAAERLVSRLDEVSAGLPCAWPRIAAAIGRALLARDRSVTEAEFETALALHDTTELPLEKVETQLLYGAWLRRTGRPARARPMLADAATTAARAGARWLTERAHEELRRADGRRRTTDPRSLTPAETRTASLAAQGLSNAEIAERLSVTVRTVETHLSRVYTKLGVSRRDLILRGVTP
ncbi:ATP-binding protein [Herbidospora yilanensis]|uniref:ATP-binding protein n=1 Tax=Herbidospora yilanensis TaxID=354426 RepID=UPI000AF7DE0D|nr:LuxR family transcriptional regulator [Herbidospora yilanensis]